MPDTASKPDTFVAEGEPDAAAWAALAGQRLGTVDNEAGVFDDTPPSNVPEEHSNTYRTAYWAVNPDYALG